MTYHMAAWHATASHQFLPVQCNTCHHQELDVRLTEARQKLEVEQAAAAASAGAAAAAAAQQQQQQQQLSMRPSSTLPPGSEPSEGALSMSTPVTMNDRQHRTAAALLASLGQTAARGRERLGRLERVLNTIAADAAEPDKVGFECKADASAGRTGQGGEDSLGQRIGSVVGCMDSNLPVACGILHCWELSLAC